ncbi:SCO6745 family protein [Actinoplanes sp. CA-015351]|uniref:SCO6745 family protein n=1 Tax=Actinoplanes sp. CA-015351 TaxID=3239897 RepID=UPI003D9586F3
MVEPIHAILYYAPEVIDEAAKLGYDVDTRWPSYFAWRAAPLGAVGAETVSSAFYSFSPRLVEAHIPAAWEIASPETIIERRLVAVDHALRNLLGDERVASPEVAEAARLARRAASAAGTAGRPLAAANAGLEWADQPHLVLWQAATILREHRGDGHVAAALVAGFDPCELLVSFAAVGAAPAEVFASRGWTPDEWDDAQARLAARGWVNEDGTATEAGVKARADLEQRTSELAAGPWQALDNEVGRFVQLAGPLAGQIAASGVLPRQSTLGLSTRS